MAVRIVLVVSALALAAVVLAMTPAGFVIAPLDQWIWGHATLASYLLLTEASPWVAPLAAAVGGTAAYTAEGVLGAMGLAVATIAGLRLADLSLSDRTRALYLFVLIWSLGIPLIVLLAMEQWMCIS